MQIGSRNTTQIKTASTMPEPGATNSRDTVTFLKNMLVDCGRAIFASLPFVSEMTRILSNLGGSQGVSATTVCDTQPPTLGVGGPAPTSETSKSNGVATPQGGPNQTEYNKTITAQKDQLRQVLKDNLDPEAIEVKLPEPAGKAKDGAAIPEFRKGPLTSEQKTEVMKAMLKNDNDWTKMVNSYANAKGSDSAKQLLMDVRSFQIEVANELRGTTGASEKDMMSCGSVGLTSDNDYTFGSSSNQSKQVTMMADGFREIFGKESGVVFDTNFYSAHIALEKGFDVSSDTLVKNGGTLKQNWVKESDLQSKIKQAEHYANIEPHGHDEHEHGDHTGGVKPFEATRFYTNLALPTAEKAKAEELQKTGNIFNAEVAFEKQIKQFKEAFTVAAGIASEVSGQAELIAHDTLDTLDQMSKIEDKTSLEFKQLESKSNDPKAIEMEAKNKIYAKVLEQVETSKLLFDGKSTDISNAISGLPKDQRANATEWVAQGCPTDKKPEGITEEAGAELKKLTHQKQELGTATMALQSKGLHYASEPYYSQATIVGVVAALQTAGNTAASLLETSLSSAPNLKKDLLKVGLDPVKDLSKMIKDFMLMGEFSPAHQEKFNALSPEVQIAVSEKIESAKTGAMDQVKKDYPLFELKETSQIAMQENHGDFVKDWGHYVVHADTPSGDQFMIKGSKYLFRTALYGEMNMDKTENKNTPIHQAFKSLKTESKAMLDVRQATTGDPEKDMKIVRDSAIKFFDKISSEPLKSQLPELQLLINRDDLVINRDDLGKSLMDVVEKMMTMV